MLVYLKLLFGLSAVLYAFFIVFGKWKVFYKKEAGFVSDYCAVMAVFLILYVLTSLAFVVLSTFIYQKIIMLFLALSPFLLGMIANYNTEKYFTSFQVILLLSSILFVWTI